MGLLPVGGQICPGGYRRTCRDLSDVAKGAMGRSRKRLYIVPQGFSPGLSSAESALISVAAERVFRALRVLFRQRAQHRVPLSLLRPYISPKTTADRQGTFHRPPNPGLKPWAVLYSRFAAKSDKPLRE
jgi:hypothetical protein